MDRTTGRPNNIEDYLIKVRNGQWFGWAKGPEPRKVYANLIVHDGGSKPTEQECTDGLAALQDKFDNGTAIASANRASAKTKLKDLGLTDDEIAAFLKT